jgi:hypothetical protein
MVIAATRIHRSLQHFATPTSRCDIFHSILLQAHCGLCHLSAPYPDNLQRTRSSRLVSRIKATSTVVPSDQLEVTVHTDTACDYPMSPMKHRGSYVDKPNEIDIDDDVEGREEKTGVPVV